jgi:uncharacterized membrane protein HdeD (DUF308 family)
MPVEGSEAEARSLASQVLLVRGILVALLGAVAVFWPDVTVNVCAVLIGILVFVFGVSAVAHAFDRRRAQLSWIGSLIGGLVIACGGLAAIFWPGPTVIVLARLFGALLIVSGFLTVLDVFVQPNDPSKMPIGIMGTLSVLCGVALLVWPDITIGVVVILQGILWIIGGLLSIWASRQVAHAPAVA